MDRENDSDLQRIGNECYKNSLFNKAIYYYTSRNF